MTLQAVLISNEEFSEPTLFFPPSQLTESRDSLSTKRNQVKGSSNSDAVLKRMTIIL